MRASFWPRVRSWVRCPASFVSVLPFLRPQDLLQEYCAYRHDENKEPNTDENDCHHAADDLNDIRTECFADSEGRRYESGVRKYERIPGQGECHPTMADT